MAATNNATTLAKSPLTLIAALMALVIAGGRCTAAELPDEVRKALAANARALNPISVRWTRERSLDLPKAAVFEKFGFADETLLLPQRVRFVWQDGMAYVLINHKGGLTNVNGKPLPPGHDEWEQELA